ncbi:MAG: exodeoxyribonuclease VII small subunit [Firmicutes bacterium]|nr:exodeoxyribonuclease VII small subunit [Bacillota bacterium]
MSFEEALGRLEEIARSLESLELGLDESLRLFQEGVRLARVCSSKLDEAEHRIEQLLEAPGGSAVVAPLEGLHK